MRRAFGFVCLLLVCASRATAATAVWIDTDASIGSPFREVDDAYALVIAFHSPEIRIAGISSTYGNASVRRTTSVTRDLTRRFGAAKVFSGTRAAGEFERATEASAALARALQKQKLTYVALGPLTNLAAFLEQHPQLAGRIERVIFVGGISPDRRLAFGPHKMLRVHDANVFKDPEAVRRVLRSGIPVLLAPVETSSRLMLSLEDLRKLPGSSGEFLRAHSRMWIWFWTRVLREKGGPVFDALPMIALARPRILQSERRYALIDRADQLIATRRRESGARAVRFYTGFSGNPLPFVRQRISEEPGQGRAR